MGNRILKILILCIASSLLYAQKNSLRTDAKGFLYAHYIYNEYNKFDVDKTGVHNKDFSGSYFVQMTDLPTKVIESLMNYYERNIVDFSNVSQASSFDAKANMVSLTCWQLCENKKTKKYIRKLIRNSEANRFD